mmetsp:Transcript_34365/g.86422  ORF Transcript_34365/g.86422 Transcript_34365/m.86422 type:complete len:266 (-) Transcript_34365:317-1114(-)
MFVASSGVGKRLLARSSMIVSPAAFDSSSRASFSSSSVSKVKLMLSACARITGTRMHVAAISTVLQSQIFCVSFTIFISSSLYPFSVIGALCEKRLKAYWNGKISIVTGSPASTSLVCCSSSAIAIAPAPDAAWYVDAIMRFTPTARCSGVTAMSAMMVEQLGLAMIPPFFLPSLKSAMASGFTSGITRGTPSVMRKADELSTTKHPFSAAMGPKVLEMDPPAENSAMSTPSKDSAVSSSMTYVSPSNSTSLPADLAEASIFISL